MKLTDFDYELPPHLIAQYPTYPRDRSRLLVLNREEGVTEHRLFFQLPSYLSAGDLLILNETKVIPARLEGIKERTGGRVELLLLKRVREDEWKVLVRPGRRVRPGTRVLIGGGKLIAQLTDKDENGYRLVKFTWEGDFERILQNLGQPPLPPYIKRRPEPEDRLRYQTVYARTEGAVAAPTAGLHFTEELLGKIRAKGVKISSLILHVGWGTFKPVKSGEIAEHKMEPEYYRISTSVCQQIKETKSSGRKVLAVGTTTVRALESWARGEEQREGWTSLFIYPPFSFQVVDGLITNFHLPRTTLLMLVSAFAGRERILRAYAEAIRRGYRFYSYGDAMLIL